MPTYNARVGYTATGGETSYAFAFPYIDPAHVILTINDVVDASAVVTGDPESGGTIAPTVASSASDTVLITRESSRDTRLVDYQNASILDENTLDTDSLQAFYLSQEAIDVATLAEATSTSALATADAVTDALDTAVADAETARDAAETAQGLAEDAVTDATDAGAAQVALATIQAGNALVSAGAAEASRVAAAASAATVANALTYLGGHNASTAVYPSDPATGHYYKISGAGTISGTEYAVGDAIVYNGSTWDKIDNTDQDKLALTGGTMTGNLAVGAVATSSARFEVYLANSSTHSFWRGDNHGIRYGFDATYAYIDAVTAGISDYSPLIVNAKTSITIKLNSAEVLGFTTSGISVTGTVAATGSATINGTAVAKQGMPIVSETTTARTLALVDSGGYIRCDNASAITVTVPTNSTVAFPIGTEIVVIQTGAGTVTFNPAFGTTVNSLDSNLSLSGQFAAATLKKVATDTWDLFGGLA